MSILDIFRGEHSVEELSMRQIEEKYLLVTKNAEETVYSTDKEAVFIVEDKLIRHKLLDVLRKIRGKKIYTSNFTFSVSKIILDMDKTHVLAFYVKFESQDYKYFPSRIGILNLLEIIGGLQQLDFRFNEDDFDEAISTTLCGLLANLHPSDEENRHRKCIIRLVHSHYSKASFKSFYELIDKCKLIDLDLLPYGPELVDVCLECYKTNNTPSSISEVVQREEERVLNLVNNKYETALEREMISSRFRNSHLYLLNTTYSKDYDKELEDDHGHMHLVRIYKNIDDNTSNFIKDYYNYITNNTSYKLESLVVNREGKTVGYEYKLESNKSYKTLPTHNSFITQAERIKFFDALSEYIVENVKVKYHKNTYKKDFNIEDVLKYKIDKDGVYHFIFDTIESLDLVSRFSKNERQFAVLKYFKKMYFDATTLKLKTREEILVTDDVRYLSPKLAAECINYILGREDEVSFGNELYMFLNKYEVSRDKKIAYYKNFAFDPCVVKYSFAFEKKDKLDAYTDKSANELDYTICNNLDCLHIYFGFPSLNVGIASIGEIVFQDSIVGVMYPTEGYNLNQKLVKNLSHETLMSIDNIIFTRFLMYAYSKFRIHSIDTRYFYLDENNNILINVCKEDIKFTQWNRERTARDTIEFFICDLELKGFDRDRFSNIPYNLKANKEAEKVIKTLTDYCPTHNLYFNKKEARLCPICGKRIYNIESGDYNEDCPILKDKYASHYNINNEYNIKVYNDKNVNLNELEKIVDEILSRNNKANRAFYEQDLFIPAKKALKDNKFIGVLYETVYFNDKSQKNFVMNFSDLQTMKSYPRLKGCARLVEQVNSLINKRLGFIYNPFGTAFISKEHKKQIQIVYPEFIRKNKNVDLADDWTIDFIKKIFTLDKDILHEFNFVPGETSLENASDEMSSVISTLNKKCEKHNYYYENKYLCCPKCIAPKDQERLTEHALRFTNKQINNLHAFNEGGEAIIYNSHDGDLIKIFKKDEVDLNFKISVLLRILSKKEQIVKINRTRKDFEYIIPKSLIISDETNEIIGYSMKKVNGMPIQTLRDKGQVKELGFETKDVLEILISEGEAIDILHKDLNIFIGDLNGRNILFDENKKVYIIDFDGVGIDELVPEFYTDEYVDPISKENHCIGPDDDWYSYAIHAFYYLTYSHPFNGEYYEKINGRQEKLDIPDKMYKRISLLGNHGVKPPAIAKDWKWMQESLINALRKIFEEGSRQNIVPLLKAQRNKLLGVIPLENSTNSLQVGPFNVDIEDRSYKGVRKILRENITVENYGGYERIVVRENDKELVFAVDDIENVTDAELTSSKQNILVYYPDLLVVYSLSSNKIYEVSYSKLYGLCLSDDTLYYPDETAITKVNLEGEQHSIEKINFKLNEFTNCVGFKKPDKFVVVKSAHTANYVLCYKDKPCDINSVSEYHVYCNDILFHTFSRPDCSNDYITKYDSKTEHWIVLGNKGDGLLITSSGKGFPFYVSEINNDNLGSVVYTKDKLFVPFEGELFVYDILKDLKKVIPLENFISHDSKVVVTKTGFKVITGSKIYTFKVNKKGQ